jgi:hypothetical protein
MNGMDDEQGGEGRKVGSWRQHLEEGKSRRISIAEEEGRGEKGE